MISGQRRYRDINLYSQPGSSGTDQTTQHELPGSGYTTMNCYN